MDIRTGDFGMTCEQPLRRPIVHSVVPLAVYVMVPARRPQEAHHAFGTLDIVGCPAVSAALDEYASRTLLALRLSPLKRTLSGIGHH